MQFLPKINGIKILRNFLFTIDKSESQDSGLFFYFYIQLNYSDIIFLRMSSL